MAYDPDNHAGPKPRRKKSPRKEPAKGTRIGGPEPTTRRTSPREGTIRAAGKPNPGLTLTPQYPGQKPTIPGRGMIPAYYGYPKGKDRSRDDVMGEQLQKLLQPALDRTPKLAKGVRVAESVGEAFIPLSVLDRVEGKDLAAGTVALDALFSIPFLRGGRAAKKAVDAIDAAPKRPAGAGKVREAPPSPARRERPAPYVSKDQEFRGSVPDEAWEPGYLYHRTSPDRIESIRKSGLKPVKPTGENPAGVYFAQHPIQAVGLAWKYKNGAYVRVRRDKIPDLEERAFGESLTPNAVSPKDIEYLGADGKWHPFSTDAEKIAGALPEARRVRAKQEALRKAERVERVGKARAAREEAGGGEAGLRASRAEMRGEYARLPLDRLAKEYGHADTELRQTFQPQVDEMLDHIAAHPSQAGLEFRVANTQSALLKMLDGQSLQKGEIRQLESVFGDEAADYFRWRNARDTAIKAANIPRALQATLDLSYLLRQLLVAGTRHPVVWQRVMRSSVRAAINPRAARATLDEIRARPRYDQMIDDGVKLTDIKVNPGRMEEDFIGAEYAEKIPVLGRLVAASTRAYTVGGAKMRADLYDLFMDNAELAGETLSKKERKSLTSVINASTGRGGMGVDILERAAPLGTVLLFSPRLIASRLAYFNPYWYATLKGPARKEAASQLLSVIAFGSAVLFLAKQLGAEVEDDPRSSDFGKIRVGDTRVDIWGGFQQYVTNGWRYIQGETKTTGGDVRSKTREEIAWNFMSGKAAPLPGLVRDAQRGRTFDYQPLDSKEAYGKAAGKLFVPLNIQNAADARDNPALAGLSLGLGGLGLGVGTYPDREDEKPAASSGGGGRSGGRSGRSSRGRYQGGPGRNYAGPRR